MDHIMDYREFLDYIRDNVQDYLDDGNWGEVCLRKVTRNNGVICDTLGLQREGISSSPVIYLQDYYERCCRGMDPDEAARRIRDTILEHADDCSGISGGWIADFDRVRSSIVMRAVNYEKNIDQLRNCPYLRRLDLALTFHVYIQGGGDLVGICLVTDDLLELWGTSCDELYELAAANMKRLWEPVLEPLDTLIESLTEEMPGYGEEKPVPAAHDPDAPELYMLSNDIRTNGAVVMFYTDCLNDFAMQRDSDIYILPSSIHEVLLLPQKDGISARYLRSIVEDVNSSVVSDEEILSGHVYRYLKDEGRIVIEA